MSAQLPFEKAAGIIESLPHTTLLVQFGGAGDPLTHPKALDIIALARERAFRVEALSNMEYCSDGDLERLTELGSIYSWEMRFIVNLSAATPRQTEKTFEKVIGNLRKLSELRKKNGNSGAHFTLMCVINRLNYHEATLYVKLAKEIGATDVWFKPLEVHHHLHNGLLPPKETQADYQRSLKEALEAADDLGVVIHDRKIMDSIAGV
jgi:MoaA/NifB/PqqE/SkfB family radical SAM enzyme